MRPSKEPKRRSRPSSPLRDRTRVPSRFEPWSPGSRSSVSVLDREELPANPVSSLTSVGLVTTRPNSADMTNCMKICRAYLKVE
ncbi:hypothetical protein FNV43_RR20428 [Rhamnella rubrinervis]|uniref:Uncharacterized protein n=1 Tax=Rhamnella rubrinervis TaxID=2594499 RepID=A0A8K0DUD9_9ROSA|nr:hypothetical protein FNV43_RR20428 [Rhamnella rubrinervis]